MSGLIKAVLWDFGGVITSSPFEAFNKFEIKKVISLANGVITKINKIVSKRGGSKIHNIEHHIAHIASAYYPSKFNDAIGLSIDGSGDFVSLAVSKCTKNNIKLIKKI